MRNEPRKAGLTVVIPLYNGQKTIRRCLENLFASTLESFDVIVVDDHSTDESAKIARSFPCVVLETAVNSGAAAARNLGAANARTDLIYFLDADILVRPDTLARTVQSLEDHPGVDAVMSSFQKDTVHQNFVSVYKNLLQHYIHQHANPDSTSFCGGFSLIRRDVFLAAGGFDPAYRFMEDVELGYRLRSAGHRILLDRELQVTHWKYLTLAGLVRSDVFERAVPWTRIMLDKRVFRNDLNTQVHHVLSVPVSFLLLGSLAAPVLWLWFTLPLGLLFVGLNFGFLSFVVKERGWWFASRAAALCWFGYLYSGFGAVIGTFEHFSRRAAAQPETREQSEGD
jgi:glycosyltransferase involved in cell wall biosynthesis